MLRFSESSRMVAPPTCVPRCWRASARVHTETIWPCWITERIYRWFWHFHGNWLHLCVPHSVQPTWDRWGGEIFLPKKTQLSFAPTCVEPCLTFFFGRRSANSMSLVKNESGASPVRTGRTVDNLCKWLAAPCWTWVAICHWLHNGSTFSKGCSYSLCDHGNRRNHTGKNDSRGSSTWIWVPSNTSNIKCEYQSERVRWLKRAGHAGRQANMSGSPIQPTSANHWLLIMNSTGESTHPDSADISAGQRQPISSPASPSDDLSVLMPALVSTTEICCLAPCHSLYMCIIQKHAMYARLWCCRVKRITHSFHPGDQKFGLRFAIFFPANHDLNFTEAPSDLVHQNKPLVLSLNACWFGQGHQREAPVLCQVSLQQGGMPVQGHFLL